MHKVGIVAIGRNEGDRLKACLRALVIHQCPIVYVDSGSTDGSADFARSLGVDVVELDLSKPFNMSRGRNAGWQRLLDRVPNVKFIQFIDGDCVMQRDWFSLAEKELIEHPSIGAVSGRRREKFPRQSVYNLLADMEWNTPIGQVAAVPGDMMVRAESLVQVNGFDESVIAAEDDELCIRLRSHGWKIFRIDAEMSLHDMAMTRLEQWWKRSIRSGYGFAQVNALHGRKPSHYFRREVWRSIIWGIVIPVLAIVFSYLTYGISVLLAFALYGTSVIRTYLGRRRRGDSLRDALLYAFFAALSKFAAMIGILTFWKRRLFKQGACLIEYKTSITV